MRRLITIAVSAIVGLAGAGRLDAQGTSAAPTRPFSGVFTNPSRSPGAPPISNDAVSKAVRGWLQGRQRGIAAPSETKCHIIVVPADPTIDPHFSVAPQSTTRFRMHEERTDHLCR